jgi:hypothetical protein
MTTQNRLRWILALLTFLVTGTCWSQDTLQTHRNALKCDILGPAAPIFLPSFRASLEYERRLKRSPLLSIVIDSEYRYKEYGYNALYRWPQGGSETMRFFVDHQKVSIFLGIRLTRPFCMNGQQRLRWFLEPRLGLGWHHEKIAAAHAAIPRTYYKYWVADPRFRGGLIFQFARRIALDGSLDFLPFANFRPQRQELEAIGELNLVFSF